MAGTAVFALLTIWLAYGLAGLLVRQVAGFARQVKALQAGESASINAGRYDEAEVVELVEIFNGYHRRMADMIGREKAFTGNVSHELRTPLTTIRTSCELLEQDASIGEKSRARLRQIDRAADRMRELADALLALAREDSAQDIEPLNLAWMIETALAPFADRLADKGIAATIDVDRHLRVLANRSALTIVLSNLIDNAISHTGHGRIRFACENGWLHVEDTGPGIPAHALPLVFERLYRVEGAQAPARGFGIGLSIVKQLCDRYGWAIELDSGPDRGTRVSLRLPSANPDPAGHRTRSPPS
jgi:signal transduction histidine kinase